MRFREVIWFVLAMLSVLMFGGCSSVPVCQPPYHLDNGHCVRTIVVPDDGTLPDGHPLLSYGTPVRLGSATLAPTVQPVARRLEVYFETGSATVSDASVVELRKTARFLRNHPSVDISLVGNCDERGSAAYNQRLGARRAESVAKILTDAAVPAARVSTVSNGKFKPLAACHAERCWAQNRRVDVIYGGW